MREIKVPITLEMLEDLQKGKEVGWVIGPNRVQLQPAFDPPKKEDSGPTNKSKPKKTTEINLNEGMGIKETGK